MQLIVFLQLYNLAFPANTVIFYGVMRDLSNFQLIPSDLINNAVYGKNDQDLIGSKISEIFRLAGYGSNFLIDNLGSIFIYIQGYICLVILTLTIRLFSKFFQL